MPIYGGNPLSPAQYVVINFISAFFSYFFLFFLFFCTPPAGLGFCSRVVDKTILSHTREQIADFLQLLPDIECIAEFIEQETIDVLPVGLAKFFQIVHYQFAVVLVIESPGFDVCSLGVGDFGDRCRYVEIGLSAFDQFEPLELADCLVTQRKPLLDAVECENVTQTQIRLLDQSPGIGGVNDSSEDGDFHGLGIAQVKVGKWK